MVGGVFIVDHEALIRGFDAYPREPVGDEHPDRRQSERHGVTDRVDGVQQEQLEHHDEGESEPGWIGDPPTPAARLV